MSQTVTSLPALIKSKKRQEKQQGNVLSSGAFASLCATTKETLYLYDKLGLLKPVKVEGNGYRRYKAQQFFSFDLISVLQESGASLRQIKDLIDNLSLKSLSESLNSCKAELLRRQKRLELRHNLLCQLEIMALEIESLTFGVPELIVNKESTLLSSFDCNCDLLADYATFVSDMARFINQATEQGEPLGFPLGMVVPDPDVYHHKYQARMFFAQNLTGQGGNFMLPTGRYAQICVNGLAKIHQEMLIKLFSFIKQKDLRPVGALCAIDLLSWLQYKDQNKFASRYIIAVA